MMIQLLSISVGTTLLPWRRGPLNGIAISISKHAVVSLSELPPDLDYSLGCHIGEECFTDDGRLHASSLAIILY